jgi:hypothetical protein
VTFSQVGWPKRATDKLETALKGSYLVSTVVHRELSAGGTLLKEDLIGLIRCTSDRVFNATIWDVLVDPQYQVCAEAVLSCPLLQIATNYKMYEYALHLLLRFHTHVLHF